MGATPSVIRVGRPCCVRASTAKTTCAGCFPTCIRHCHARQVARRVAVASEDGRDDRTQGASSNYDNSCTSAGSNIVSHNLVAHFRDSFAEPAVTREKKKGKEKRQFLLHMFDDLPLLFEDATELATGSAQEARQGEKVQVPSPEWVWFGFPCQDVSVLNSNAKKHRQTIVAGNLRTGGVFKVRLAEQGGRRS